MPKHTTMTKDEIMNNADAKREAEAIIANAIDISNPSADLPLETLIDAMLNADVLLAVLPDGTTLPPLKGYKLIEKLTSDLMRGRISQKDKGPATACIRLANAKQGAVIYKLLQWHNNNPQALMDDQRALAFVEDLQLSAGIIHAEPISAAIN